MRRQFEALVDAIVADFCLEAGFVVANRSTRYPHRRLQHDDRLPGVFCEIGVAPDASGRRPAVFSEDMAFELAFGVGFDEGWSRWHHVVWQFERVAFGDLGDELPAALRAGWARVRDIDVAWLRANTQPGRLAHLADPGIVVAAAAGMGHDQAAAVRHDEAMVLVVADGAGGMGGAFEASSAVVQLTSAAAVELAHSDPAGVVDFLGRVDHDLAADPRCGESTAIVVVAVDGMLMGASVGDSEALLYSVPAGELELTEYQRRKPLLGSGAALPMAFGPIPLDGRLVLATDGLWKYVTESDIGTALNAGSNQRAAERLLATTLLPSSLLRDDVAVVVV